MTWQQHTEWVRAAYDFLVRGDIAGLTPTLALDAVGHEYDGACYRATYHGRAPILARLDDLAPSYWDAVRVRMHAVAATGPLTAVIATWQGTSRATGQTYAVRHVLVVRVTGHQITDLWLIRDAPIADTAP